MALVIKERVVGSREFHRFKNLARTEKCRRQVFVQTDAGSVLGIELDRTDNAQNVKTKMQMALNVPIEESSITFGVISLSNGLSVVKNDSPLRLTPSHMHRSSSTPCFSSSSTYNDVMDLSPPLEIIGGLHCGPHIKKLIREAVKAMESGVDPVPVQGGLGGAYYMRNLEDESIAIVKPTDEEPFAPNNPKGLVGRTLGQPGLHQSIPVGETGVREVAAYLLDHDSFAKVPPTILIKITHPVFHVRDRKPRTISKIASFQQFVAHEYNASDLGSSKFSVSAVHRIGILDVRILNADRHSGNILVKTHRSSLNSYNRCIDVGEGYGLVPIDHGLCLPQALEDPYFEWLHWAQASVPFADEELEYIRKLDPFKDADMLRTELPMLREASLRILVLCTIFLKGAAASGLCLSHIGEMMTREFCGMEEESLSQLEILCIQAKADLEGEVLEEIKHSAELEKGDYDLTDHFQFEMELESEPTLGPPKESRNGGLPCLVVRSPIQSMFLSCHGGVTWDALPSLHEGDEEEEEDSIKIPSKSPSLSLSPQGGTFKDRNQRLPIQVGMKEKELRRWGLSLYGVMIPEVETSATNCISFASLNEEEWVAFLGCFEALLPEAFESKKNSSLKQGLATSFQF
ncbi:hypothetical protein AMTRI_Chr13g118460 [Amborella trichopoda]